MKVVIASYDDEPPQGGQGVYVRGLRRALQEQGEEVRTVSGRGANAMPYRAVTHRPPLDFSLHLSRDPSALQSPAADVVHAQGGPGGVLLLRRIDAPLVYTAHHTYRQAYRLGRAQRAMALLEHRAYKLADKVIAVSQSTADAVRAMGIGDVEVIPPGIDVERLSVHGDALRDPTLLLFAGRLEAEKAPLDAVAAMCAVHERIPAAHGVVVGRGRLEAQVREAAVRSGGVVEFRGGVSDDELAELYAKAAVLLVPSRYEGLGMVALEAMAAGAAVVATDVVGLRDAVSGRGLLVRDGDVSAMARQAAALLADPFLRSDICERARHDVLRTYSWGTCAEAVRVVYRHFAAHR